MCEGFDCGHKNNMLGEQICFRHPLSEFSIKLKLLISEMNRVLHLFLIKASPHFTPQARESDRPSPRGGLSLRIVI
jgi:hypothetical protein